MRRKFGQTLGVGRFEIHRDTSAAAWRAALDLFRAGHDLEMDVATKIFLAADDVNGVEQLILRADAATGNARTQKIPSTIFALFISAKAFAISSG